MSTVYFRGYGGIDRTGRVDVWRIRSDSTVNLAPTFPTSPPLVFDGTYYFDGIGSFDSENNPPTASLRRLNSAGMPENMQLSFEGLSLYSGKPLIEFDDKLYFTALRGGTGGELYTLDKNGVVNLVSDIFPGIESSVPRNPVIFNDEMYFFALKSRDSNYNYVTALYKLNKYGIVSEIFEANSNGEDLGANPWRFFDTNYIIFNSKLYIPEFMSDASGDFWLWTVNQSGNIERAWQSTVASDLQPKFLTLVGQNLYFLGQNTGYGIYRIDADGSPQLVVSLSSSNVPSEPFVELNGMLYFMSHEVSPSYSRLRQIWRFDGQSIQSVSEIFNGESPYQGKLIVFNGEIYYFAGDGESGFSLWKVTASGFSERISQHISPETSSGVSILATTNALYFTGYDPAHGWEPWQVGTDGVARRVADINESPTLFAPNVIGSLSKTYSAKLGQDLIFSGTSDGHGLIDLWRVGINGITKVTPDGGPSQFNNLFNVVNFNGNVVYEQSPFDPVLSKGLWMLLADGTRTAITNVEGDKNLHDISRFGTIGSNLFFIARSTQDGPQEIWKLDSSNYVNRAFQVNGNSGILPGDPISLNGNLYYATFTGFIKIEPNGSISNIINNKGFTINTSATTSTTDAIIAFNGEIYFPGLTVTASGPDGALWKMKADGSFERVLSLNPNGDYYGSFPSGFIEFNNEVYFRATDGNGGRELWKIRADSAVVLAADIRSGPLSSTPYGFIEHAGELYFSAEGEGLGRELWKISPNGVASLVSDVIPGAVGSNPYFIHSFNGKLYFRANTGIGNNAELWFLDVDGVSRRVIWQETSDPLFVPRTGSVDTLTPGIDSVHGVDWYIGEAHGLMYVATTGGMITIDHAGIVRHAITTAPTQSSLPTQFIELLNTQPITDTGTSGNDRTVGGIGHDIIYGIFGEDLLIGNAGNDMLDGGVGSDTLSGGDGDDYIYYDVADTAANVTGGNNFDILNVVGGSTPTGFNLVAQGFERAYHQLTDSTNQAWSSIRDIYGSNWARMQSNISMDDNTRQDRNFDHGTSQPYSEYIDYYLDVALPNNVTRQVIIEDTGTKQERFFDYRSNQAFSEYINFYADVAFPNAVTRQVIFNDGGTKQERIFDYKNTQPAFSEYINFYTDIAQPNKVTRQVGFTDEGGVAWEYFF